MLKLIIVIGFSLFACYATIHFVPSIQNGLTTVGGWAITGTMLVFLGAFFIAWKYTK